MRFNPLFLYGGVGLGKTHLMRAIAWEIRARHPERKVMYLSAEKFMYQFIKALRGRDTMAFKEALRSVDVLMIDDVQFIGGKGSTQDEFFHTFNALVDNQKQLVISADRSPSNLDGIEERIKSRLSSGLVADIHPTDYELRLGILQTKAKLCLERLPSVDVPKSALEFLAQQIASNVRELEGALTRIIAYAELVGQPVTMEMTREVMADLLRGQGIITASFDMEIACLAGQMPWPHRDPFDRIIAATAMLSGSVLASADAMFDTLDDSRLRRIW